MTLEKFRIYHSTLIEHYQFIEWNLEGIYSLLSKKDFLTGLQDVEKDNISRLANRIRQLDPDRRILSDEDYDRIIEVNAKRNYYAHDCYLKIKFDPKTGDPDKSIVPELCKDLLNAEMLRDYLFDKKYNMIHR